MRKLGTALGPSQFPTSSVIQTLLEELTCDELERVASAVIREHRSRLQTAQDIFEEIGQLESTGAKGEDIDSLQQDYHVATLNLHLQHQLVSLVVNRLGHVPEVDGQRPILN